MVQPQVGGPTPRLQCDMHGQLLPWQFHNFFEVCGIFLVFKSGITHLRLIYQNRTLIFTLTIDDGHINKGARADY